MVHSEQEDGHLYHEVEGHSYHEEPFWTDDIPVSHETTSLQLYEGSASPSTDETPEPQETTSVPPLYEGSALTAHSSSVLILQYKMRHQLTEEALADLLQLIKMHCPIPNQCPASVFLLKKHFPNLNYTVQLHHYCSRCMQGVDIGRHKTCTNELCKTDLGSCDAISAFIEVPIECQLKLILESE